MRLRNASATFLFAAVFATAASAANIADVFSQLLIFGDSISDSGDSLRTPGTDVTDDPSNTLAATTFLGTPFPPSPYFNGRFSNGPVWSDMLIAEFEAAGKSGRNYAFGGAQAVREVQTGLVDIPDFEDQRLAFQSDPFVTPGPRPLAVVYFGGNDLFSATTDDDNLFDPGTGDPLPPAQALAKVRADAVAAADAIKDQIALFDTLTVSDFALVNSGDVGATPRYANATLPDGSPNPLNALQGLASAATAAFNARLVENAAMLRAMGMNVIDVDVATPFADLLSDPDASGFMDTTTPCGVELGRDPVTNLPIVDFGAPDGIGKEDGVSPTGCITEPFSGLAGAPANVSEFAWFDGVHPTTRLQVLLADEIRGSVAAAVPLPAPVLLLGGALVALAGLGRRRARAVQAA